MPYRPQTMITFGAALLCACMAASAGTFDNVSACHDMAHLTDQQNAADKQARSSGAIGKEQVYCLDVPQLPNEQVCMAGPIVQLGQGDIPYTMTYRVKGEVKQTWTESGSWIVDPYSFSVESVDLSGTGENAAIVNVVTDVSNGMGRGYSDIYIFESAGAVMLGPIKAEDYGSISGLYRFPGRDGCVLLVSKWDGDKEPGRGDGTYAKGHWYIVDDGKLTEYAAVPSVERRLLYRFWNDRWQEPLPRLWFKDPTTRILKP